MRFELCEIRVRASAYRSLRRFLGFWKFARKAAFVCLRVYRRLLFLLAGSNSSSARFIIITNSRYLLKVRLLEVRPSLLGVSFAGDPRIFRLMGEVSAAHVVFSKMD